MLQEKKQTNIKAPQNRNKTPYPTHYLPFYYKILILEGKYFSHLEDLALRPLADINSLIQRDILENQFL